MNRVPATRSDWSSLLRFCLITEGAVFGLLVAAVVAVRIAKGL